MEKGKLIVIEGACDGIGKSTQFDLLRSRLESEGEIVISHHFPSYGEPQGKLAEDYLHGKMGDISDLSVDDGSMSYVTLSSSYYRRYR